MLNFEKKKLQLHLKKYKHIMLFLKILSETKVLRNKCCCFCIFKIWYNYYL